VNPTIHSVDGKVCLEQSEWRKIALQKTVSNLKFGWQGFINPMSSQFLKRVLFVICVVHIWLSFFCVKKRRPGSIYWSVSSILSTVWAEWGFVLKSLQFGIRVLSTYRESKKRLVRKIFKIANISFLDRKVVRCVFQKWLSTYHKCSWKIWKVLSGLWYLFHRDNVRSSFCLQNSKNTESLTEQKLPSPM